MNSLIPEMHLARSVGGSLRIRLHTALNYTSVLSTIAAISLIIKLVMAFAHRITFKNFQ